MGFFYVLSVPIAAGLGAINIDEILGFSYTGWMWAASLIVGILLVQVDMALVRPLRVAFPCAPWLLWFGFVWLSLLWSADAGRQNLQEAIQISMPLLVGMASSMFVTSEAQLKTLLRVIRLTLVLSGVSLVLMLMTEPPGNDGGDRVLAMTAALIGCVFIAGSPRQRLVPLLGWAACLAMTVLTGSRMATVALLVVPVLHPLYGRVLRGAIVAGVLAIAAILFHMPVFQERFFSSGYGTLEQLFAGEVNLLGSGRFAAWPMILDEAWRHPVVGAGVGSAHVFVPTLWPEMHQVHNDYLRIGFELGIVGLGLFLGVMAWQMLDVTRQIGESDGYTQWAFVASFLGLMLFLIMAITDNPILYNLWFMNPLFAVMGAAYGVARNRGCPSDDAARAGQVRIG